MSRWSQRFLRGLSDSAAATAADAEDRRLRGRTYAIPFDDVWRAAYSLPEGGLRRWRLVHANDEDGRIHAEVPPLLFGEPADVYVRIGLDENGQTRVDVRSASRSGRMDLGANARRIHRFCRALDRALEDARARRAAASSSPASRPA